MAAHHAIILGGVKGGLIVPRGDGPVREGRGWKVQVPYPPLQFQPTLAHCARC